jgi:purine-binding chemotaxis protein CheW
METQQNLTRDKTRSILSQRAMKLAMTDSFQSKVTGEKIHVAAFIIGNEFFCIETIYISEIISVKEYTPLPGTPGFVKGIINVRGKIVAVLDPCEIFQVKHNEIIVATKIIILESSNHKNEFGIIVDSIEGTLEIMINEIEPAPQNLSSSGASFIREISTTGIIILDANTFISSPLLVVNHSNEH